MKSSKEQGSLNDPQFLGCPKGNEGQSYERQVITFIQLQGLPSSHSGATKDKGHGELTQVLQTDKQAVFYYK